MGRNYAEHARELNNPVPASPLLFIKPATALAPLEQPLRIPRGRGAVHHELEVALLMGTTVDANTPAAAVAGIGLALDLTLRDEQAKLKDKGHPWEIAKAFDGACPCSAFIPQHNFDPQRTLQFSLTVNGKPRQRGSTDDMLFGFSALIEAMSQHFTLQPGDIVLTGTPAGVGELCPGDQLEMDLAGQLQVSTQVLD